MYDLTVKERLIRFATYKCNDIASFEREAGLKVNALRSPNDPTMRVIQPIMERFPDLNPDWLILGMGTMLRPLSEVPQAFDQAFPNDSSSDEVNEPTKPYTRHGESITLPRTAYDELVAQLKVKDQQLQDAAAQIATLLNIINK